MHRTNIIALSEAFSHNHCYLCDKPLSTFSKTHPCIHWLLKPKGFKNKDIELIAEQYGFFQIQSLLRWYANEDVFGKNINDLQNEGTGKLFEVTIKHKHIEWSFSCSESDYQGHATRKKGNLPHYHFQMRIDKRPFINFNKNHMPFSDMDIINIEAMKAEPGKVKQRFSFGEGMSDFFNEEVIHEVLNNPSSDAPEDDSAFSIDSFVVADEGTTISGDEIYKVIQEAKETGVTIASLLHKVPNGKTSISVSPGPGVIEQTPRSGGRKTKNNNNQ
jgi:hypothetical protein